MSSLSDEEAFQTVVVSGLSSGRKTPDAENVIIHGEEFWLPKSQFHRRPVHDSEEMVSSYFIPRWLADKLELNWEEYDPDDWGHTEEVVPLDFNNS